MCIIAYVLVLLWDIIEIYKLFESSPRHLKSKCQNILLKTIDSGVPIETIENRTYYKTLPVTEHGS